MSAACGSSAGKSPGAFPPSCAFRGVTSGVKSAPSGRAAAGPAVPPGDLLMAGCCWCAAEKCVGSSERGESWQGPRHQLLESFLPPGSPLSLPPTPCPPAPGPHVPNWNRSSPEQGPLVCPVPPARRWRGGRLGRHGAGGARFTSGTPQPHGWGGKNTSRGCGGCICLNKAFMRVRRSTWLTWRTAFGALLKHPRPLRLQAPRHHLGPRTALQLLLAQMWCFSRGKLLPRTS